MGCGTEVICRTCKVVYWCGYGTYGNFDERAKRFPGEKHVDHDLVLWNEDAEWGTDANGDLYVMGAYGSQGDLVAKDYRHYLRVNLLKEMK